MVRVGLAVGVAAAVAGLLAVLWGVPSAGGTAAPRWRVVVSGHAVPNFEAVDALSSRDVWAVGTSSKLPIAAHWDGRSLTVMKPFQPSVTGSLDAVAALAPDDVWAVGTLDTGARSSQGVIVHWDGGGWRTVVAPLPSEGDLAGVTAISDSDVWVGGSEDARVDVTNPTDSETVERPLLLHWDGHGWARADISALVRPCPRRVDDGSGELVWFWDCGSYVAAIDATRSNNVWAAVTETSVDFSGYGSAGLHFDGTSWIARSPATQGDLGVEAAGVDATAPGEAWTLDRFVDPMLVESRYRLIHWTHNGQSVHSFEYETPGEDPAALAEVSRTSVWMVGQRWSDDGNTPLGPIVIHWNGRRATRMHTTLDAKRDATLTSIDALSPFDIWAAGDHLLARYSR